MNQTMGAISVLAWSALIAARPTEVHAGGLCEIVPPSTVPSCLVHFGEGEFEVNPGSAAALEVEACLRTLGYGNNLLLIGHADACPLDTQVAARMTGGRLITSEDSGNSLLGEKRIDEVSSALSRLYAQNHVPGMTIHWRENRSDADSRGHDDDDRTVELRPRVHPGCPRHPSYTYLIDGSGSMEQVWRWISGIAFPADSCIYLVSNADGCPGTLGEYRPYGPTWFTTVAADFIRKGRTRGLVLISDMDQGTSSSEDYRLMRTTLQNGDSGVHGVNVRK